MNYFPQKTLKELFSHFPEGLSSPENLPSLTVTGIDSDSRLIKPGNLFVALLGNQVDGHQFIDQAIKQGATAIVGMKAMESLPIPYIQVKDTRPALAYLAAAFYSYPAHDMTIIGVTGTDGKTTTTNILYKILETAGYQTGMITSVNAVIGNKELDTGFHVTTPEALDVQRYLGQMRAAGITHAVLESTSHGLAQHRVTGCEFDVAVFTNITHEHLDYHKTYESYREAKAQLLYELSRTPPKNHGNSRLAVLNRDDDSYEYLHSVNRENEVSYGISASADVRAENYWHDETGLHIKVALRDGSFQLDSQLLGKFNVYNILAAYTAAVYGLGCTPDSARKGIAALEGVAGRMEKIDLGQDFVAMVDFAHTPNALRSALMTVRELTRGRVIAVFGSAGLRDKKKRQMMAEISIELADLTVLTAEDPRTESLEGILDEMSEAAVKVGGIEDENFWRVSDRGNAIQFALGLAHPGDVVISCGKGHEQSMCFGITEYFWDDRVAMRAALADLLNKAGPTCPYLPTRDSA